MKKSTSSLALSPDDHVAIVVDEGIPQLARLLVPLLEHIGQAHVKPDAITFLYIVDEPPKERFAWIKQVGDKLHANPGPGKKLPMLRPKMTPEMSSCASISGAPVRCSPHRQLPACGTAACRARVAACPRCPFRRRA
jgi:hypothetical protein